MKKQPWQKPGFFQARLGQYPGLPWWNFPVLQAGADFNYELTPDDHDEDKPSVAGRPQGPQGAWLVHGPFCCSDLWPVNGELRDYPTGELVVFAGGGHLYKLSLVASHGPV